MQPWSQPHKVDMMLECSPGELLARAAFMHHDNHGHAALMRYAILKGLKHYVALKGLSCSPVDPVEDINPRFPTLTASPPELLHISCSIWTELHPGVTLT